MQICLQEMIFFYFREKKKLNKENIQIKIPYRKQPKCPLTDEWIQKTWYIHTQRNTTQP